jgi:hypothetical protein
MKDIFVLQLCAARARARAITSNHILRKMIRLRSVLARNFASRYRGNNDLEFGNDGASAANRYRGAGGDDNNNNSNGDFASRNRGNNYPRGARDDNNSSNSPRGNVNRGAGNAGASGDRRDMPPRNNSNAAPSSLSSRSRPPSNTSNQNTRSAAESPTLTGAMSLSEKLTRLLDRQAGAMKVSDVSMHHAALASLPAVCRMCKTKCRHL